MNRVARATNLDWFPPENDKILGSHHHESHELVAENLLNFISLITSHGACIKPVTHQIIKANFDYRTTIEVKNISEPPPKK